MAALWSRLPEGQREECASVSCGHAPAQWRLDAGGTGSFFCDCCHGKIVGVLLPPVVPSSGPILKGASPVQVYQMNNNLDD